MTVRRRIKDPELLMRCLREALSNNELVAEFDRLTGFNLGLNRGPIVQMIDEATGYVTVQARAFYGFVVRAVYWPLQDRLDAETERQGNDGG